MEIRLRIPLTNIIIRRFGFLLISILLLFVLRPFLVGYEVLMNDTVAQNVERSCP